MHPRHLLERYAISPRRDLGQNFLSDPGVLAHIVRLAAVTRDDLALEIGAGTGTLTRHLAEAAGRVIALETDDRLIPILRQQTSDLSNVEVAHGDILDIDIGRLVGGAPYHAVGNLPYYITSAILRRLLETPPRPRRLTVTVQREVAERLVARPGAMSLLSVSVQFYGRPEVCHRIKAGAFWPTPGVDSAVVCIDVYGAPPVSVEDERGFFQVVRAGFGQKRKQLKNALASGLDIDAAAAVAALVQAHIQPDRRAETLSLDEWASLTRALSPHLPALKP